MAEEGTGMTRKKDTKGTAGGRGDGSIYQRKGSDRWEAKITLLDGTRRVFYGKTFDEVRGKLADAQENAKKALPIPAARLTVADLLDRWLRDVAALRVRRTTLLRYTADVENHIKPSLGKLKLRELTPERVQKFIAELSAAGLSPRSVAHCRAVLRIALGQAEREGAIGRNVAKLVTLPRQTQKKVKALGPDEARALLDAFQGDEFEHLVTLALATGMRQGELLGLSWGDIDLDAGTVRVRKQLQRIEKAYELTELKTERSRRTLSLPAIAVAALRAQRTKQAEWRLLFGPEWQNTGLVFTTPTGRYLNGPSLTHRFQEKLKKAGIAPFPF